MNKYVQIIGKWAACLSIVFAIGYSIPQILSALKIITYPSDQFWLFLPSLFLASTFLITMVCLHYAVGSDNKIWTGLGIAFALIYTTLVSLVYFAILAVILPLITKGKTNEIHVLYFPGRSFLMAVDCLGYAFMCLSTFFIAFAFKNNAQYKWLYISLLANGLLMPFIILAFFFPIFLSIGALWIITVPMAMIKVARFFTKLNSNTSEKTLHKETDFLPMHAIDSE